LNRPFGCRKGFKRTRSSGWGGSSEKVIILFDLGKSVQRRIATTFKEAQCSTFVRSGVGNLAAKEPALESEKKKKKKKKNKRKKKKKKKKKTKKKKKKNKENKQKKKKKIKNPRNTPTPKEKKNRPKKKRKPPRKKTRPTKKTKKKKTTSASPRGLKKYPSFWVNPRSRAYLFHGGMRAS